MTLLRQGFGGQALLRSATVGFGGQARHTAGGQAAGDMQRKTPAGSQRYQIKASRERWADSEDGLPLRGGRMGRSESTEGRSGSRGTGAMKRSAVGDWD